MFAFVTPESSEHPGQLLPGEISLVELVEGLFGGVRSSYQFLYTFNAPAWPAASKPRNLLVIAVTS